MGEALFGGGGKVLSMLCVFILCFLVCFLVLRYGARI